MYKQNNQPDRVIEVIDGHAVIEHTNKRGAKGIHLVVADTKQWVSAKLAGMMTPELVETIRKFAAKYHKPEVIKVNPNASKEELLASIQRLQNLLGTQDNKQSEAESAGRFSA